ncbi:MAG: N-acetylmuramoyl-L-alanine amidase-like domain-containing protein [Bacteroidota bacterium]
MLRLVLAVGLLSLGASCGASETDNYPESVEEASTLPAAPPASNARLVVSADVDTTDVNAETLDTFRQILADASTDQVADRSYGEIVQWVGEQLIGRPYVAGMLDAPDEETLVVDLTGFDCVLYVENVLAMASMIALGQTDYATYAANVQTMRYRDGELAYCSRLHYFSDWIRDNERRGAVQDVTASVGGEPFEKEIRFMTENRDAYRQLADDSAYACVVDMEAGLAGAELFYVPQNRIAEVYDTLQPGDVIATATSIGGLDVTHTGFVHKTSENTGFMHASLSSDAVKVSDDLEAYVQGISSQIGIVIARPVDPRG